MVTKKTEKKQHKISEKKVQAVKEIAKLIDSKNTFMIATTYNLLSHQFQAIRKSLRGKAEVRFVKKNVALKAIEASKREGIQDLAKYVTESPALIISDEDPYAVATILSDIKYPARAKTGQNAKEDIVIQAGPTDLMPGQVLTELGNVGLKAGIVGGKVTIKETHVLVKKGEKIPKTASDILMKLEITPFTIELEPVAAYDASSGKVYNGLKIDKAGALAKLKESFSSAFQFAIKIGYPTQDTISQILVNAEREAIAMNNLTTTHTTEGQ